MLRPIGHSQSTGTFNLSHRRRTYLKPSGILVSMSSGRSKQERPSNQTDMSNYSRKRIVLVSWRALCALLAISGDARPPGTDSRVWPSIRWAGESLPVVKMSRDCPCLRANLACLSVFLLCFERLWERFKIIRCTAAAPGLVHGSDRTQLRCIERNQRFHNSNQTSGAKVKGL